MDQRFRRAERQYASDPSEENLYELVRSISRFGGISALNNFLVGELLRWDVPARIVASKSHAGVFSIPMLWKGKTRGYRSFVINGDGSLGKSPHARQRVNSLPIPGTLIELVSKRINGKFMAWDHDLITSEIAKAIQPSAQENDRVVHVVSSKRIPYPAYYDDDGTPEPSEYLNGGYHSHQWILKYQRWEEDYDALDLTLQLTRVAFRDMLSLRIDSNVGYSTGYSDDIFGGSSEVQGGMISGPQYQEFGFAEPYEEDEDGDPNPEYEEYQELEDYDLISHLADIPILIGRYFSDLKEYK